MSQLGTKIFDEHHGSTIEEWQGAMLRAAESSDPSFPNFRHLARLGSLNLATGIEEAFKLYKIARPHLDKCVGPQKTSSISDAVREEFSKLLCEISLLRI